MKIKRRFLLCTAMLLSVLLGTVAGWTTVLPVSRADSSTRVVSLTPEKGGCPVWKGKRLRSTNSRFATVQFSVGFGRVSDRGNTGNISLRENIITANSYTPDILALSFSTVTNDVELIRDPQRPQRIIADPGEKGGYTSQSIKQVRAPEAFMDIVVFSEWEYEIRFYRPEQVGAKRKGFYTVSGEPISVSRIRNPNPPNTDSLEITFTKDGTSKRSEYRYDASSDTWLFFDDGVDTGRKLSEINPNDPCERIETRYDLEEGKWLKTIKYYKGYPWGQELVRTIVDPDGEAKTTIYKYWDDPNGPHYTFLKTTIHPDGRIQRHNRGPDPFQHWPKSP